jgi:hypothetical protein
MLKPNYDDANAGKADFEWTYNRLDPRSYFQVLGALDYAIPENAAPIFDRVLDSYSAARGRKELTALDIGCSYGINSAVLKYGHTMPGLREHYLSFEPEVPAREVLRADGERFTPDNARRDLRIIGLDRAKSATSYGYFAGLLDGVIPDNLEACDPSTESVELLAGCDLVISTGAIGYVGERTFARIMGSQPAGELPWVASFVLRMFDFGPVGRTLEKHGYTTEKLAGRYFRQRRFESAAEQDHAEGLLRSRGLDPAGLESDGYYLAEFFLSRPKREAIAAPLPKIMANA